MSGESETESRLARVEERLAWLQRHVTEQDRAMLELTERMDRLQQELRTLRERSSGEGGRPDPVDERPPHY